MHPTRNHIELLPSTPITCLHRHRNQVLAKIARKRVNTETLTGRILDLSSREGASGSVVANLGFGDGGGVEDGGAGASDCG